MLNAISSFINNKPIKNNSKKQSDNSTKKVNFRLKSFNKLDTVSFGHNISQKEVQAAVNGSGRIARAVIRRMLSPREQILGGIPIKLVAVNSGRTNSQELAHLLTYDSTFGRFPYEFKATGANKIEIETDTGRHKILLLSKNIEELPWKNLGVDIIAEASGKFNDGKKATAHLASGAKKVVITAPAKNVDGTFCLGINHQNYNPEKDNIVSMASCTTNGLAPILKVLHEKFGIVKGFMKTVHAYTNDQNLLDNQHGDLRRARSAAVNIIPTKTGAAEAIKEVLPE
jgi:glyceraldehyde 3-phosphate dehydrogenase